MDPYLGQYTMNGGVFGETRERGRSGPRAAPERDESSDGDRSTTAIGFRSTGTVENGTTEAVEDRTASDVFAELRASTQDADADEVLGDDSPESIIERADEPVAEPRVDDDLFDESAFEELVIPDRHRDGEFLWIDAGSGGDEPSTDELSIDEPSTDELSIGEPSTDELSIGEPSSDEPSNEEAPKPTESDFGSTIEPTRERRRDDGLDDAVSAIRSIRTDRSGASGGVRDEPTVEADGGDEESTTGSDSASSIPDRPAWITDEFDSVSSPSSGKVPTRDETASRAGRRPSDSHDDGRESDESEADAGPDESATAAGSAARRTVDDRTGDDAPGGSAAGSPAAVGTEEPAEPKGRGKSEVRTRLDRFEHRENRADRSGPVAAVRRTVGRFVPRLRSK